MKAKDLQVGGLYRLHSNFGNGQQVIVLGQRLRVEAGRCVLATPGAVPGATTVAVAKRAGQQWYPATVKLFQIACTEEQGIIRDAARKDAALRTQKRQQQERVALRVAFQEYVNGTEARMSKLGIEIHSWQFHGTDLRLDRTQLLALLAKAEGV